jgi:hypothetical protein
VALSFSELKKSSKTSLAAIRTDVEKLATKSFSKDDKGDFWEPTVDKAGNGYAVIRFLPPSPNEDVAFVRRYNHGFKGPTGKWYIQESRTSMGSEQKDPVSEYNSKLWQQGEGSEGRKIVTGTPDQPGTKRRMYYTANIYIVSDPSNPDNDGKVKLFKFGKKVFEKLNDVMHPKFEDETALNPFDLWEGANFKLKIRKVDGYRSYDKSEFAAPSIFLDGDDKALEKVWSSQHSLEKFMKESEYKSYAELQNKLNEVMGLNEGSSEPRQERTEAPRKEAKVLATKKATSAPEETDDDETEVSDFFQKLAAK